MPQADQIHSTSPSDTDAGSAASKPKLKRLTANKQRKLVETAIDRLVALLDEIDPDPQFEENGDSEPSLNWPIPQETIPQEKRPRRLNADADLRGDAGDDREHDTADSETSLGSLTSFGSSQSQEHWVRGASDDREKTGDATESEDEEPFLDWGADVRETSIYSGVWDGENEPDLGWTEMEARAGRYG
jgi:hypothetical protein